MLTFSLIGLESEGIYRISGFADDVEALKNSFDKGVVVLYLLVAFYINAASFKTPVIFKSENKILYR